MTNKCRYSFRHTLLCIWPFQTPIALYLALYKTCIGKFIAASEMLANDLNNIVEKVSMDFNNPEKVVTETVPSFHFHLKKLP